VRRRLLEPFALEERVKRIEAVVRSRCFGVLPIVEGLYDMGNFAAVCRSADALGYGAVHCINRGCERSAAGVLRRGAGRGRAHARRSLKPC
jgi:tRNA (guanosine-2'-O-)-methyltransferase